MAKERVFAVVGLGTFGREVCRVLARKGGKVIAVDNDQELVERIQEEVTQAVLMDSTDEASLRNAPLDDVDAAVVAMGDNIEASVLTTALLKKLGIPYIVARAVSEIHEQVLQQVGADEVINLEIEQGQRVASRLIAPEILDVIPIAKGISVAEVYAPRAFVGKDLKTLDLRKRFSVNVISIKRPEFSVDDMGNPVREERVVFPEADQKLESGDVLLVVGHDEDIDALKRL